MSSLSYWIKRIIIGDARNLRDPVIFQKISLIAFLAWVGIGADGLSSSCYGPQEAFKVLLTNPYLSIFVALAVVFTIFIIATSYSQIVETFPTGGGGYIVASKLLSPTIGMVSGCALIVDYVLTIAISIVSGTDAFFSFLPSSSIAFKPLVVFLGISVLTLLNMRGAKESVLSLLVVFLTFVFCHAFILLYISVIHLSYIPTIVHTVSTQLHSSTTQLGFAGTFFLIISAYVMGAGTYTGIEAVSNSMPILSEPKVETAKHTMRYMTISLAVVVFGLLISYALYQVKPVAGKTLNAVLFEAVTKSWGNQKNIFVMVTLLSETAILFVAAQTGFIDGPRVLSYMAVDNWFPKKFSLLSDRLVTQNGILAMGIAATVIIIISNYSVGFLIILYSINVFITFSLSQLGMVKHWWLVRNQEKSWTKKISVNGIGLFLTSFILISVIVVKFHQGGWLTLVITGGLIIFVSVVKNYYKDTGKMLSRLDELVLSAISSLKVEPETEDIHKAKVPIFNPRAKTAVICVNGFTGLGLHTLYNVMTVFEGVFENFVFVQIGIVDAGNFKGVTAIDELENHVKEELKAYTELMKWHGYHAEGFYSIGRDVVEEIEGLIPKILEKYPNLTLFGGQLVFATDSLFSRWLHNYTVFAIQRALYNKGVPVVILPISPQVCTVKKTS